MKSFGWFFAGIGTVLLAYSITKPTRRHRRVYHLYRCAIHGIQEIRNLCACGHHLGSHSRTPEVACMVKGCKCQFFKVSPRECPICLRGLKSLTLVRRHTQPHYFVGMRSGVNPGRIGRVQDDPEATEGTAGMGGGIAGMDREFQVVPADPWARGYAEGAADMTVHFRQVAEQERQERIAAGAEHVCASCGCSSRSCPGGCVWATATLCSRCASADKGAAGVPDLSPRAEKPNLSP